MNNITITKSIAGAITIAVTAFALAACSSSNSAAPEASVALSPDNSSKQTRLEPSDESTDSAPTPPTVTVSAKDEATLESWLNGNPINNSILVNRRCAENPDFPDDSLWCLPHRIQMEKGTVAHAYNGNTMIILCETETDTISYIVQLHNNIITKKWTNPFFNTEAFLQSKAQFKQSCKAENGDVTEDSPSRVACDIVIKPSPSQNDPSAYSRQYFTTHHYYYYEDSEWTPIATRSIVEGCRTAPMITIEPKPEAN